MCEVCGVAWCIKCSCCVSCPCIVAVCMANATTYLLCGCGVLAGASSVMLPVTAVVIYCIADTYSILGVPSVVDSLRQSLPYACKGVVLI